MDMRRQLHTNENKWSAAAKSSIERDLVGANVQMNTFYKASYSSLDSLKVIAPKRSKFTGETIYWIRVFMMLN